jgi:hypothetical protein
MLQSENSDRKAGDDVANARRSVSRFGDIPEPLDDPILADMFKRIRESRGHLLNIHRDVGLAPKMLRAQVSYARALREGSLPHFSSGFLNHNLRSAPPRLRGEAAFA